MSQQIHYISHREERLPEGQWRELFGIGDRYRALRGNEKAIERAFAEDSRGLRRPAYFRFILTVDNHTAERFARLDGIATERVIRDAIQRTFRGAARDVQGVFAIHQHGGHDRPAHPHVHALFSPRLHNGAPIHFSPRAIERVKERWHVEVLRALQRREKRLVVRVPQRELIPLTSIRRREFNRNSWPCHSSVGRGRGGLDRRHSCSCDCDRRAEWAGWPGRPPMPLSACWVVQWR